MKYLAGTVQASVAILYPVCRWLSSRGRVPYGDLNAALRPAPLVSGGDNALIATLQVGRDMGLLERSGSARADSQAAWSLQEPARSTRDDWYGDPIRFRVLIRRALLGRAVADVDSGTAHDSDIAVGLAWLLAQDPICPLARNYHHKPDGPERLLIDQKLDSYINGQEQWRPFLRWAVALGCAQWSRGGGRQLVLPDPTAALAEELPPIPPGGLPARDFCDALAAALPVLDGGKISEFMRKERAVTRDPRGDAMIGPAFSLALHRLQYQGLISLNPSADAAYGVNGVLHGKRWTFDRVTRGNGNSDD